MKLRMYLLRLCLLVFVAQLGAIYSCQGQAHKTKQKHNKKEELNMDEIIKKAQESPDEQYKGPKVVLKDKEWKNKLEPEVYQIARKKGTERPFTGKYLDNKKKGLYRCRACGAPLFTSDAKFDSGCGWPSFYEPVSKNSLVYKEDNSFGMHRIEIECGRCGAHLGHVFNDAPDTPTGLRYCLNSLILDFVDDAHAKDVTDTTDTDSATK